MTTNDENNSKVNTSKVMVMVEKMIDSSVERINDLKNAETRRIDDLREKDLKRSDDLRDVQVKRIDDSLNEHKEFNRVFFQEHEIHLNKVMDERDLRLAQKFISLAEAINKADQANEKRFDSVNEFRAVLTSQQNNLLPRVEYDSGHKNLSELVVSNVKTLSDTILTQKERIDKIDNVKQGGSNVWILVVGIVGFVTGLTSFILNLLGK
jgi:phosphopantetheinyl transferase (holo-ACP synthase)